MSKDEKKEARTREDMVKAREICFKELLGMFLPGVLDKLLSENKLLIPPNSIK